MSRRIFLLCILLLLRISAGATVVTDSLHNELSRQIGDSVKSFVCRDLSWEYLSENLDTALHYANKGLTLAQNENCLTCEAKSFSQIATVYYYQGEYAVALEKFLESLRLNQRINDKKGMMACLNNLGGIHISLGNYNKASDYFSQSYEIASQEKDTSIIIACLSNIGICERNQGHISKAKEAYFLLMKMTADPDKLFDIYINLAGCYRDANEFPESLKYYEQALKIATEQNNAIQRAYALAGIAVNYGRLNETAKALEKAKEVMAMFDMISDPDLKMDIYSMMHQYNFKLGNYREAYESLFEYMQFRDSLFNEEKSKILTEAETKFEVENKERENELLRQDNLIQQLEINEKDANIRVQNMMIIAGVVGLVLLLLIVFLFYGRYLLKKRANEKLSEAFQIISEKNKDITDSMTYARDLQDALLPKRDVFLKNFDDSFVLFRPKDIVSGDFFWLEENEQELFFAVADCTGHGVPAAMVSVVAINGLTRSIREMELKQPGSILNQLTVFVEDAFRHSEREIRDGLDVALCTIRKQSSYTNEIHLQFSGANNPLWIMTEKENIPAEIDEKLITAEGNRAIYEIKGNKQPIGNYAKRDDFSDTEIILHPGDCVLMFSDGFADQFGGEEGKKYKYSRLKKFLLSIAHLPMDQQRIALSDEFDRWKGDLEQIDDVCIVGIRF